MSSSALHIHPWTPGNICIPWDLSLKSASHWVQGRLVKRKASRGTATETQHLPKMCCVGSGPARDHPQILVT